MLVVLLLSQSLSACAPCIESGKNGVGDPDPDEFQLVFSNIVSRDTMLHIDNLDDGNDAVSSLLCSETEYITVGNFPVSPRTTIEIQSAVSESVCFVSPCCDSNCDEQVCTNPPVVDTTPFAGRIFGTGLVWRF